MKLIDLLVQELPKRGGWPDSAVECCRHYGTNSIDFYDETGNWDDDCYLKYGKDFAKDCIYEETSESHHLQSISRPEYESSLAASKKPAWNGEGVPPVGCEFEYSSHSDGFSTWHKRKCTAVGRNGVLCVAGDDGAEIYLNNINNKFRQPHSEADKRRDSAIEWFVSIMPNNDLSELAAGYLYDAIAAGKIPGVKLED